MTGSGTTRPGGVRDERTAPCDPGDVVCPTHRVNVERDEPVVALKRVTGICGFRTGTLAGFGWGFGNDGEACEDGQ
ncbi:hypothetical protein GCM10023084_22890 [Streptomyces lacrimifluminis]